MGFELGNSSQVQILELSMPRCLPSALSSLRPSSFSTASNQFRLTNFFCFGMGREMNGGQKPSTSAMSYTVEQLIAVNPYNPNILPNPENFINEKVSSQTYNLDANLCLLRLYQFEPERMSTQIVARILVKEENLSVSIGLASTLTKSAKSEKSSSPATDQPNVHVYPDWAAMQAYYGPRVAVPPYYNSAVASGHPPHPYMWDHPRLWCLLMDRLMQPCMLLEVFMLILEFPSVHMQMVM